jgi:ATP-binding cassette subfamily B protein
MRKIGEMIARMSDTRRIQSVISTLTGSAIIDLLLVFVSIGFVASYSWWIGCVMLGSVVAYILILLKFNKPISLRQKEVMAGYALTESNFIDSMQGISEIKLMGKENLFERLNQTVYEKFQKRIFSLGKLNIKFTAVSEITGVVFIMLVFGLSSVQVLSKELSIGELVALLGMAGNIIPSLARLVVANIQIQEARVVFDRMFEFTSMEKESSNSTHSIAKEEGLHLKIDSVSFRFPGRKQILSSVSLEIMTGKMIALVGESGGGKSTLLQMIQKFYQHEGGNIYVNDVPLGDLSTESWRSNLGCVSQDVKIFNNSLLFNITLSDEVKVNEDAILFCENNGFGKYFNQLPQSYLTLVGEEGVNLSGGQKQLVAIARALFRNPKLLLLDEATSAMDRKTEDFIIRLMNSYKENAAILFVTHRIRTANLCDHIYVLENGQIVLDGKPIELRKLVEFQDEMTLG